MLPFYKVPHPAVIYFAPKHHDLETFLLPVCGLFLIHFQALKYLVDLHKGNKPVRSPLDLDLSTIF